MTGQSTSPPTTLGKAPSIPATTTSASAPLSPPLPCRCRSRWSPATPTSATSATSQFHASAVTRASSATGRSLVPAVTTTTLPSFGPGSPGGRIRNVRPEALCSPCGKARARCAAVAASTRVTSPPCPCRRSVLRIPSTCSGVFPWPKMTSGNPHRTPRWRSTRANPPVSCVGRRLDPGDQAALAVPQERLEDSLDLLGGLPLPENDLGKPAPDTPMEIDPANPPVSSKGAIRIRSTASAGGSSPCRTRSSNLARSCESMGTSNAIRGSNRAHAHPL